MKFRVIIEQDEDGVFVAHCPALPGCISQGATREEAQANIKEAVTGYWESLKKHGELIPPYSKCKSDIINQYRFQSS
ncbi:MAG: type II toxin-antitoxin system HicB family antitoxin [Desulfobaccales bacterium]